MGHTVTGDGGKCANLHGHRYRFHFKVAADRNKLDALGMVVDFSVIKDTLCRWLDQTWDHKFMVWREDERAFKLNALDRNGSVIIVEFNPTVENIAAHFLEEVAPSLLPSGYTLVELVVNATLKCSARATVAPNGVSPKPAIVEEMQAEQKRLTELTKRVKRPDGNTTGDGTGWIPGRILLGTRGDDGRTRLLAPAETLERTTATLKAGVMHLPPVPDDGAV